MVNCLSLFIIFGTLGIKATNAAMQDLVEVTSVLPPISVPRHTFASSNIPEIEELDQTGQPKPIAQLACPPNIAESSSTAAQQIPNRNALADLEANPELLNVPFDINTIKYMGKLIHTEKVRGAGGQSLVPAGCFYRVLLGSALGISFLAIMFLVVYAVICTVRPY